VRRRRSHLAEAFETVLLDALRPAHAFTARAPVARRQVVAAQGEIEQLVARLRDSGRGVDVDGLHVTQELLCDLDGPLFDEQPPGGLREQLKLVRVALD
jgi:hypothetical protein